MPHGCNFRIDFLVGELVQAGSSRMCADSFQRAPGTHADEVSHIVEKGVLADGQQECPRLPVIGDDESPSRFSYRSSWHYSQRRRARWRGFSWVAHWAGPHPANLAKGRHVLLPTNRGKPLRPGVVETFRGGPSSGPSARFLEIGFHGPQDQLVEVLGFPPCLGGKPENQGARKPHTNIVRIVGHGGKWIALLLTVNIKISENHCLDFAQNRYTLFPMPRTGRIYVSQSVSFPPGLLTDSKKRADNLGLAFSTYVQKCIEKDLLERGAIVFEEAPGDRAVAEDAPSEPSRRRRKRSR